MKRHPHSSDNSIPIGRSEFSMPDPEVTTSCYEAIDAAKAHIGLGHRVLLEQLARGDKERIYRSDFLDDMTEWTSAHLGISRYKATRYIACGHALERLPLIANAVGDGSLILDKAVELTRFATDKDERKLLSWAKKVSVAAIKARADEFEKAKDNSEPRIEDRIANRHRWLDNGYLWTESILDPVMGKRYLTKLRKARADLPVLTKTELFGGQEDVAEDWMVTEARNAYAFMALIEDSNTGSGSNPEVVIHVPLQALVPDHDQDSTQHLPSPTRGPHIAGGPAISPGLAKMICCDARLRIVLENTEGYALGIGHASQSVPFWLESQVRFRDSYRCTFPGCDRSTHLVSHHIDWWGWQGETDLDNLITVCSVHHRHMHMAGWRVSLGKDGTAWWFRPDGMLFDPSCVPKDPDGSSDDEQLSEQQRLVS